MARIGRELVVFGGAPLLVAFACGLGLVGGITDAEAFVPMYLLGLILAITALGMFGVAAMFRALRWLAVKPR